MKVPKIRFPEFIESYTQYRLGDIYQARKEEGNADLPMLSVSIHTGISDGELDENELGKRIKRSEDKSLYKRVHQGDLVFNMMRAWQGAIGTAKIDGMVSPAYIVAKPDNKIDPLYMNYYMRTNHMIRKMNNQSYGIMEFRKRLYWNSFVNIRCNIPALSEQNKIAELLSAIDTVIEKQKEMVVVWENRKKSIMQKLFSQEVRFKADDGNNFPEWKEKKLDDCGRFYTGVGFGEKYQGHKDLDIDVYKVSDMNIIGNEKYMTLANNTIDESIVEQMKTKAITSRCLIFAKVGAAIYGERKRITTKTFLIDNNMMAFEPYSCLNIEYLHSWACSIKFSRYAQVGALPSYNSSDIGIIKIQLPCLEEQKKIASCIAALDDVINSYKTTLVVWKELKKGLMQQMFI